MYRKFFIILAIVAACISLPRPSLALANLPPILPDCDQTLYRVQAKDGVVTSPVGPIPEGYVALIPPENFGPGKPYTDSQWNLTGYTTSGNCSLNDFLQLFVNLFDWMLYIISILGVLMLFVGGGTLLMSGGSEERVRSGKAIITNTVIGIAIALGSWLIINTVYVALLPEENTKNGIAFLIDKQPWFRTSTTKTFQQCSEPPQYPCKGGVGAETVRKVQDVMYTIGCYSNPGTRSEEVDGSFGAKTLAAWKRWQQVNNVTPTNVMTGYDQLVATCQATSFDENT